MASCTYLRTCDMSGRLGSAGAAAGVSICGLSCMGHLKDIGLLTWWPRDPRASDPKDLVGDVRLLVT